MTSMTRCKKAKDGGKVIGGTEAAGQEVVPTGIRGFDAMLRGGLPRNSLVLLAGSSGSGKTLFALEWLFKGAEKGENGAYITTTEPLMKTVRYAKGQSYYDERAVNSERVHMSDMRQLLGKEFNEETFLERMRELVEHTDAKRLVIDSFTGITQNMEGEGGVRRLVFRLGNMLSMLGCTTLISKEVDEEEGAGYGAEGFIVDGIVRLSRVRLGDSYMRTVRVVKMRGIPHETDMHTFKITGEGVKVFTRELPPLEGPVSSEKVSIGVEGLDEMTYGGLLRGSLTVVSGPAGSGKSNLSLQFIADGLRKGETCVWYDLEESRAECLRNAKSVGIDLAKYEKEGLLRLICLRPEEKCLDEHLLDIRNVIEAHGPRRLVIDSLTALSNIYPHEMFRNFVKRLDSTLKGLGVTAVMTTATSGVTGIDTATGEHISTLADNIITLRQVEMEGELRFALAIVKTRGSRVDKRLRGFAITDKGFVVKEVFAGVEGVLTGTAKKVGKTTVEKLREEFSKVLGPSGPGEFEKLSAEGLTEEKINSYVDGLVEDKILKPQDAEAFRLNCRRVLKGE